MKVFLQKKTMFSEVSGIIYLFYHNCITSTHCHQTYECILQIKFRFPIYKIYSHSDTSTTLDH